MRAAVCGLRAPLIALSLLLLTAAASAQAATFTVTSTANSGPGSLRQAILDSNGTAGVDKIAFSIAARPAVIVVRSAALPAISDPVVIDGSTQPGYRGVPGIEILNRAGRLLSGLTITAGSSLVRALDIYGFYANIRLDRAGGNRLVGNLLGVTPRSGQPSCCSNFFGILVGSGSGSNVIGGTTPADRNVISSCSGGANVQIAGSNNVVEGNYIGPDRQGTASLASPTGCPAGVLVIGRGTSNRIGGTVPGSRNVISGLARGTGVQLFGGFSTVVEGNYIGLDATGRIALQNRTGVLLEGTASVIGGTTPAARNIISGAAGDGVSIKHGATGNQVEGNYIGTSVDGMHAIPNGAAGVAILHARHNTIGGDTPAARNLISANTGDGVLISEASYNVVERNFIGTDRTGSGPLGNGQHGVEIDATRNFVGTRAVGSGNRIAFNGADGVAVEGLSSYADEIFRNSLFDNQGLGISLINGSNAKQPSPIITSVQTSAETTTINGKLTGSAPSRSFRIELFASDSCDPSGRGEGQRFLGLTGLLSDATGAGTFSKTIAAPSSTLVDFSTFGFAVPQGQAITATASDLHAGNTSAFSVCQPS